MTAERYGWLRWVADQRCALYDALVPRFTKRAIPNRNESRQFALWQVVADVGGLRERGDMWHHRRSRDGGSSTRQLP